CDPQVSRVQNVTDYLGVAGWSAAEEQEQADQGEGGGGADEGPDQGPVAGGPDDFGEVSAHARRQRPSSTTPAAARTTEPANRLRATGHGRSAEPLAASVSPVDSAGPSVVG